MYTCEMCGEVSEKKWGSGRFCGRKCAAKFSASAQGSKKAMEQTVETAPQKGCATQESTVKNRALGKSMSEIQVKDYPALGKMINPTTINNVDNSNSKYIATKNECRKLIDNAIIVFKRDIQDTYKLKKFLDILTDDSYFSEMCNYAQRGFDTESAIRITFAEAIKKTSDELTVRALKSVKGKLCYLLDYGDVVPEIPMRNHGQVIECSRKSEQPIIAQRTVRHFRGTLTREQAARLEENNIQERMKVLAATSFANLAAYSVDMIERLIERFVDNLYGQEKLAEWKKMPYAVI